LFFIVWTLIEQRMLVTTQYEVTSSKLPQGFHNTKIVVLADLHNYTFGRNNERLIRRIVALNPGFIIVAGDMINKREACYPSNAYTLLEELAKSYKIYYAYGNHEQRVNTLLLEKELDNNVDLKQISSLLELEQQSQYLSSTWVEYKDKLSQLGVIFIDNQSIDIVINKNRVRISGVSIGRDYFKRSQYPDMEESYLSSLIGVKPENQFQILIAHNPVYFDQYLAWGADLTISGHLHGGMVRIPGLGGAVSPQVKLFPKYDGGQYTKNEGTMIVSRGLGSHSFMPRYFNIPEVVQITLKRLEK